MKIKLENIITKNKSCQVFDFENVEIQNGGQVVFGKYNYDRLESALEKKNRIIQILENTNTDKDNLSLNYPDLDLLRNPDVTVICDSVYPEVYEGLLKDKSPESLMMAPTPDNISSMVILLMRDLNRVSHVHQKLTTIMTNLRIFPAIDALTPHAIDDCVREHKLPIMKPIRAGRIGCLFSHISLWKDLLASKSKPAMMILEDDNIPVKGYTEKFGKILKKLPATFDLLHLYLLPGEKEKFSKNFKKCKDCKEKALCLGSGVASGQTCAYLISRKGASKLVKIIKNIKEPIDVILKKQVENDYLETYAVCENLFQNVGVEEDKSTKKDQRLKSNTSTSQIYNPE
tara:strand:- start:2779 stop:3810 length:1032 start_codon:yes stop_codon:yes gene_type:complete